MRASRNAVHLSLDRPAVGEIMRFSPEPTQETTASQGVPRSTPTLPAAPAVARVKAFARFPKSEFLLRFSMISFCAKPFEKKWNKGGNPKMAPVSTRRGFAWYNQEFRRGKD